MGKVEKVWGRSESEKGRIISGPLGECWSVTPAWICRGLPSCPLFAGSFHRPVLARPYLGIDGVGLSVRRGVGKAS